MVYENTFRSTKSVIGVNFFFEDRDGQTDLNQVFEHAIEQLGRRPGTLPKN